MNRTRNAALFLLVGLLSSLVLTACGQTAEGHLEKGNEFLEAMQFAEAAEEYEKALEIEPDNVDVMSNLGVTLLQAWASWTRRSRSTPGQLPSHPKMPTYAPT